MLAVFNALALLTLTQPLVAAVSRNSTRPAPV
jgi:hypothetical protein